ncbi:hypothetical protein EDD85DRAFT_793037 [Armillaria nabsnona]|nr:hypothetical protein EDD85DRAFT_793037 [Armillaria nabsnona]
MVVNHYRALFPTGTIPTVMRGQASDWPDITPVAHIGRIHHGLSEMIPSDLLALSQDRQCVVLLRELWDLKGLGKALVSIWDMEIGSYYWDISDWDLDVNHPLLPISSVMIGFESESPVRPNEFDIQAFGMEETQTKLGMVTQNHMKITPTLKSVTQDGVDYDVDLAIFEKEIGLCWILLFYGDVEDPYRQYSILVSHDMLAIGMPCNEPLIVKFTNANTWDRLCSAEIDTSSETTWDSIFFFRLEKDALTRHYQNMLDHYMNFAYHSKDFLI